MITDKQSDIVDRSVCFTKLYRGGHYTLFPKRAMECCTEMFFAYSLQLTRTYIQLACNVFGRKIVGISDLYQVFKLCCPADIDLLAQLIAFALSAGDCVTVKLIQYESCLNISVDAVNRVIADHCTVCIAQITAIMQYYRIPGIAYVRKNTVHIRGDCPVFAYRLYPYRTPDRIIRAQQLPVVITDRNYHDVAAGQNDMAALGDDRNAAGKADKHFGIFVCMELQIIGFVSVLRVIHLIEQKAQSHVLKCQTAFEAVFHGKSVAHFFTCIIIQYCLY